jgi:hypothetical protein
LLKGTGIPVSMPMQIAVGALILGKAVLIAEEQLPGGTFDRTASQCLGVYQLIDGKTVQNGYCEFVDADGDKYLARYSDEGARWQS